MRIHMIGCGEVGQCYARALADAGHTIVGLYDGRETDTLRALAAQLGARLVPQPDAGLAQADLLISAVYGGVALEVATQVMPLLAPGTLYADFTTASPDHMRAAAGVAAAHGVRFIDVAITGAISMTAGRTPLLCAGADCQAFAAMMTEAGAPIRIVGAQPGDAASLKLMRSIITKGMEALAVECLVAAQRRGLRDALFDVLGDIDRAPLRAFLETCVRTHVQHAPRRLAEVREAKRQLRDEHLQPLAMDGVEALFLRTAQALEQSPPRAADTVEASLAWLEAVASMPPADTPQA